MSKSGYKPALVEAEWVINIPDRSKVLIEKKSRLKQGDAVARVDTETREEIFPTNWDWHKDDRESVEKDFKGKKIHKGDLLLQSKGMNKKTLLSPAEGLLKAVDEFGSLVVEMSDQKKKLIETPVGGVVEKNEDGKITITFKAWEIVVEELVEGKVWADSVFEDVEKLNDINSRQRDNLILMTNPDITKLMKAEVVGVAAVVIDQKIDGLEKLSIPIVKVEDQIMSFLKEWKKESHWFRVLLNSNTGRLLVVVE